MSKRVKSNRKYTFNDLVKRIREAGSEVELELISDLIDQLVDAEMLTAYQYRELDYALDDQLCHLVLEGKA